MTPTPMELCEMSEILDVRVKQTKQRVELREENRNATRWPSVKTTSWTIVRITGINLSSMEVNTVDQFMLLMNDQTSYYLIIIGS